MTGAPTPPVSSGSFFDFWGDHSFGSTRIGIEPGTDDPNLFAWTFAGGNGFSFSRVGRRSALRSAAGANGDDDYEGQEAPDGVANIRVDQGWGSAQIMGAVRHIHDVERTTTFGFAVGAGLGLDIPGGWRFDAQGGYSEGAIAYISGDPGRPWRLRRPGWRRDRTSLGRFVPASPARCSTRT